jgi:hypothetical protein
MHFPKYWARGEWSGTTASGEPWEQLAWDCSDESLSDAQVRATAKAQRLGQTAGRHGGHPSHYPYADREVREPILRTLDGAGSECAAVITRTAYGSEVLNAERLMFIDIDLPIEAKPVTGWFAALLRLFRGGSAEPDPMPAPAATPADAKLAGLRQWHGDNPSWSFRVYRTHSGLRYLVTSDWQDPLAGSTHSVLNALGCDARYQQLCKVQKSFRARLTPKPWRCGCDNPPVRFPYDGGRQEALMQKWLTGYEQARTRYATCQFLATVGNTATPPAMSTLVTEHDTRTKATSGLPLA